MVYSNKSNVCFSFFEFSLLDIDFLLDETMLLTIVVLGLSFFRQVAKEVENDLFFIIYGSIYGSLCRSNTPATSGLRT